MLADSIKINNSFMNAISDIDLFSDGGDINILAGTVISGSDTSSLSLHANRNINISNTTISVGTLKLNAEKGGIDITANSELNTLNPFNANGSYNNQTGIFLVAGGSFSDTSPYQINPSSPSYINLSNSRIHSLGEVIGATSGCVTINNSNVTANADLSFESRNATFSASNSNITSQAAFNSGNQSSAITILSGGGYTFSDTGRPYNFSAGSAATLKVENTNISIGATSGLIALLTSGELQITGTNGGSTLTSGKSVVLVAQGGPVRITDSRVNVLVGSGGDFDDVKGLITVAGGDLTFNAAGDFIGYKLAGAGTNGNIITTNANISSSTNKIFAVASEGINTTNTTFGNSNIALVAGGAINVSANLNISTSVARFYSRSSLFQLNNTNTNSTNFTSIKSTSQQSLLVANGSAYVSVLASDVNLFEDQIEGLVTFGPSTFVSQFNGVLGGALASIQASLSPSAMLPPPVPQAPPPMQPQTAPQQPAQQNQQPQPQAKQPAPDGDAPAPNQAPSNQQPAANKAPAKDGAAADAPDGETAAQPKQAANDPAAPAPAPSAAPRQTASNAPAAAPAPAPAPQSTPANNAAPAPVAPAAPTQVSLAAPPPPVAPPPPTPVATEKPPTPKDAADSGDKTLAMAAPQPPSKPATQSQASTTRTSVVSVGLVDVQVPVPPRPPSGAAVEQPMPTLGNSARW